jgi:hypothetical protein
VKRKVLVGHYLWPDVAKLLWGKNFVNPTIKKSKTIFYPTSKTSQKDTIQLSHILYHFCDMSLITACAIFCSLKFHVVCTCTFFGDTVCLLTKSENDQDSDSDWLTYCIDIWLLTLLLSLRYLSESCFGNDNRFLVQYPTLEWFCFSFIQPFTHSKFCLPNPFLFGATPRHK